MAEVISEESDVVNNPSNMDTSANGSLTTSGIAKRIIKSKDAWVNSTKTKDEWTVSWPWPAVDNGTANDFDIFFNSDCQEPISREKVRTILDVLSEEERIEIKDSIAALLCDDENVPAIVKWLVYERLRQRYNNTLLERKLDILREAVAYAPKELADKVDAECAAIDESMVLDAYVPVKDEV